MRSTLVLCVLLVACSREKSPSDTGPCLSIPVDGDGDGYGSEDITVAVCGGDIDALSTDDLLPATDCDDGDPAVHPGAEDATDGVDNDCDGVVDPGPDADLDGDGYSEAGGDCDDSSSAISPAAEETCNGIDDDCDGEIDVDAVDAQTWYADKDGDLFGDPEETTTGCDAPSGYVEGSSDCDDSNSSISPAEVEDCRTAADDDCDGSADSEYYWSYPDADGDGYGDESDGVYYCYLPDGYILVGTDCDDDTPEINPGAREFCDPDDVDEDCDGAADSDDMGVAGSKLYYPDADEDTYGDPDREDEACEEPVGYVEDKTDCADGDDTIYPGAPEICGDGHFNDCDTELTWTVSDEYGHVAFFDEDGEPTDLTSVFSITPGSVVSYTLSEGGDLKLCGDPSAPTTWYLNLDIELADVDLVDVDITGVYGRGSAILSGGGEGSVITTYGAILSVNSMVLTEGSGAPYGGAIYTLYSNLLVDDCLIADNSAAYGGGIYADIGVTTISDTDFTDNYASGFGGGIYVNAYSMSLDGVNLTSNSSGGDGGGLFVASASTRISGSTLNENEAVGYGGGMALSGSSSATLKDSVAVKNNDAENGGGVSVVLGADLTLEGDVNIVDNTATYGGGIYLNNNATTASTSSAYILDGASVSGNTAAYGGGAYLYGGVVEVSDASIDGNTATNGGGGIWAYWGEVDCAGTSGSSVRQGIFDNASSYTDAGGIWLGPLPTIFATSCDLDNAPYDIYASSTALSYTYGEDATFSCTPSGCY